MIAAEDAYVFRHAVLRDAAYQLVLPSQRGRLHRVALETLEAVTPDSARDAIALELAGHAEAASTSRETNAAQMAAVALHYLVRGADYLERTYAFGPAADALGRAAQLAAREPGRALEYHLRAAGLLRRLGNLAPARDALEQADILCDAAPEHRWQVLAERGQIEIALGHSEAAEAVLQQAVNLLRPRGASPELARVLGGLANACHGSGKLPLAEQLYDEACAMDTTGSIVLRVNRAMLYMDSRGHSAALHMTEELVQECRRSGNRYALASVLVNHGILLHRLPDAPAARAAYLEAGKLARELGLRLVEQVSLSNLSVLNFNQQGPAAALGDTRRSLELAREIGDRRGVVTALVNLAAVQDKLGQVRHGSMREANTLARRIGDPILRITVLIQRGLAAAARNRQGAAWRILERAEHLVRRSGLHADSQAASQTQLLRKELLDRQHRA